MIQRYNFEIGYNFVEGHYCTDGCCMEPNNDGKYVLTADHESDKAAAMAEKDKEIKRLKDTLEINAGTACSLNTDVENFRSRLEDEEQESQKWRDMCNKLAGVYATVLKHDGGRGCDDFDSGIYNAGRQKIYELLSAYNAMKDGQPASEPTPQAVDGKAE